MTNYNTVRNILVPLMGKYLTVECVTDEKSGKWVTVTGYLNTMGGASDKTGSIILKGFGNSPASEPLPLRGIVSILNNGELVWKRDETETAAEKKCMCSGLILFYGGNFSSLL